MKKKLAIITSGGGMTCSYTGGFLRALAEEHNLTEPDIAIAGSGSAGSMAYYVAKQYKESTDIWKKQLSTKEFINPLRFWEIMNIDYLIDVVLHEKNPIDTEQIYASSTFLLIPATNYENGHIKYFTNRNRDDIYEALRATKALPILYGKDVKIKNCSYCDSRLTSKVSANIVKAIDLGATHIVVVNTDNPSIVVGAGFNLWLLSRPKKFRDNFLRTERKDIELANEYTVNICHISPRKKLPLKLLGDQKEALVESVALGYNECKDNKELENFLREYHTSSL